MKRRTALLALLLFPFLACGQEKKAAPEPSPSPAATVTPAKAPKVRLKTTMGDIVIELNTEKAPITVENFLGYVKKKHYDGTVFHRLIPGFMIQGGGFTLKDNALTPTAPGKPIKNEGQNGLKNDRGTIAMARTGVIDSATDQFFINVADNANLNYPSLGGYAVFGKVVEGMDVVDKIKAMETTMMPGSQEKSLAVKPVVIQSATAE